LSVNAKAAALVAALTAAAATLKIDVRQGARGETLIDAGSKVPGSVAAGLRVAEICMGGLGTLQLSASATTPRWPWTLLVHSAHPVIACLASQYAGWRLTAGEGKDAFFALGSGPARALARTEPLFETLDYHDSADSAVLVLESARPPPPAVVDKVAEACGLKPERVSIIYAPTQSVAGGTQIVARVLEVALHKAHEIGFPLARIVEGMGAAPLAPPHPDMITAMGRTNDAIIYAGRVHLMVTGPAAEARALAEQLPSEASRDYGQPFAEIFNRFKGDFYAIDPMLFSPAQVTVTALDSGESFHTGRINLDLLNASFA
ncbi:MAG TPA: methenyltetrahydromethanopterin cyclohydrolase, partial [Pseudolabrys sp.]|nr:methenyltetrahydromethanopterin cyclohydrolase [Pseudolabrys sp.]